MTEVPQAAIDELTRYRACMANLLAKLIAVTQDLEARIDAASLAGLRTHALLLRKARIHVYAVLRANQTDNPHSLAVQMRPVLECAGQKGLKADRVRRCSARRPDTTPCSPDRCELCVGPD